MECLHIVEYPNILKKKWISSMGLGESNGKLP